MPNSLSIKVCGITKSIQAEQLLALDVDYIGMIYHQNSPRHIESPSTSRKGVLVSVDQSFESITQLAKTFQTRVIQLHGNETPMHCKKLESLGFEVIKSFSIDDDFDFKSCKPYENAAKYLLFDTKGKNKGGNGTKFNWLKLKEYSLNKPFFLSGGISMNDIASIQKLSNPQLFGIDINSQFETTPGIKDLSKVSTFINQLRH